MGVSVLMLAATFDGVFCAVSLSRDVLEENWDLIKSVSEGFSTYFSWRFMLLRVLRSNVNSLPKLAHHLFQTFKDSYIKKEKIRNAYICFTIFG